ncbi:hypothetical protein M404DRAFT_996285, partial [Pisolithus tinctorius Marx 270]
MSTVGPWNTGQSRIEFRSVCAPLTQMKSEMFQRESRHQNYRYTSPVFVSRPLKHTTTMNEDIAEIRVGSNYGLIPGRQVIFCLQSV